MPSAPSWRSSHCPEDGASAVEYGLLLVGVAGLIAAVVFVFGDAVLSLFDTTCEAIATGSSGSSSRINC
jgi:pilus assembly protein Flp/PilA